MNASLTIIALFIGCLIGLNKDSADAWIGDASKAQIPGQIVAENMANALLKGLDVLEQILPHQMQPLLKRLQRSDPSSNRKKRLRRNARAILYIVKKSVDKFERKLKGSGMVRNHLGIRMIPLKIQRKLEKKCVLCLSWFGFGDKDTDTDGSDADESTMPGTLQEHGTNSSSTTPGAG